MILFLKIIIIQPATKNNKKNHAQLTLKRVKSALNGIIFPKPDNAELQNTRTRELITIITQERIVL